MNVSRIMLAGLVAAATLAARAEVKIGDSRQQVIAELGMPQGEISTSGYSLLTFERGRVELRSNLVSKIELVSEEQMTRTRELREQQRVAAEKAATEARLNRIAEGTEVRKKKLADSTFSLTPASERVAYWQNFKKLYPEVPLGDEYTVALKELEQQLALQRVEDEKQRKVDDLERRVADAEARARQAERSRSTVIYTDYGYPPTVVGLPYWSHRCSATPCSVCTAHPRGPVRPGYTPVQRSLISSPFVYDDCDANGLSVGWRSPGISIQFNRR